MSKAPASEEKSTQHHILRRKPNFASLINRSSEADNYQVAPGSISTSGESARESEQPLPQTPPDSVSSQQQADAESPRAIPSQSWPSLSSSAAQTTLVPRTDGSSEQTVPSLPYRTHPRPGSPSVMLAIDPHVVQARHLGLPMLSNTSPTSTSGPRFIGYAPASHESGEEGSLARPGPAEHSFDGGLASAQSGNVEMPRMPPWPDDAEPMHRKSPSSGGSGGSLSPRTRSPWHERRHSNSSRESADADEANPRHTRPYILDPETNDLRLDLIIGWLDQQSRLQESTQMKMDLKVLHDQLGQMDTLRDTDIPRAKTQLKLKFIDSHLVCTDPHLHRWKIRPHMRLRCTQAPTLEELNSGMTWRRATRDEQASRQYFYEMEFFAEMVELYSEDLTVSDISNVCDRLVSKHDFLSMPNAPQEVIDSITSDIEAVQDLLGSNKQADMKAVTALRWIKSAYELMRVYHDPPSEESRAVLVAPSGSSTADECLKIQETPVVFVRAPTGEWPPDTPAD